MALSHKKRLAFCDKNSIKNAATKSRFFTSVLFLPQNTWRFLC